MIEGKLIETSSLCRIKDFHFYSESSSRCPILIRVHGCQGSGRLAFLVASEAAKILNKENPNISKPFKIAGKSWGILKDEKKEGRFRSLVNQVHKVYKKTYAKTYDVYETGWWSWGPKITSGLERSISFFDHFVEKTLDDRYLFGLYEPMDRDPFTDPFTRLATLAFQEYETHFDHKNDFNLEDSDYRIVFHDDQFSLVKRDHPLALDPKIRWKTLEMYLAFVREKYGEEKINEINFRYEISPSNEVGLTPEHVYRINIGVHNIDMDDVAKLWDGLLYILSKPKSKGDELSHTLPLDIYLDTISSDILPQAQRKALFDFIKKSVDKRMPEKRDLITWIEDEVKEYGEVENLEQVSVETFDKLMSLLIPDPEACKRSLTGREIFGFIRSYYSNAETKIKPWVDQQEFFQTICLLRNQKSKERFLEKLVHIIVKKRLARKTLSGDYRVGLLIPAPLKDDGLQHWYRVSSCIGTPTGLMNYTLHPAVKSDSLDWIKFYRSTDSDVSPNSVYNDFNPCNSPGYGGIDLPKNYEYPYFKQITIAMWVAFTCLAKRKLAETDFDPDAVYNILYQATESLDLSLNTEYRKKDLRKIIRKNDVILNELYRIKKVEYLFRWRSSSSFGAYNKVLNFLSSSSDESEIDIARLLFNDLERFSAHETDPKRMFQIVHLKDQLFRHILVYHEGTFLAGIEKTRTSYCDILMYKDLYCTLERKEDKLAILNAWVDRLDAIAVELKENIEVKTAANLILAGHSLGGASASAHMVSYFVEKDRILLPGHRCLIYLLCDPAINDDDNERFKQWGLKHQALFKELDIKIKLKRRLEVGDMVPLAGEAHLGSTYSSKENEQLKQWLSYDFRLRERLESAKSLAIAWSSTAHETQFEEGKACDPETGEGDYLETKISSDDLGRFDHRGKIQTLWDEETGRFTRHQVDEEMKNEQWLEIMESWQIGDFHARIDSEWVRTNPLVSLVYYMIYGDDDQDSCSHLTDEQGVFVVTEKGVITKRDHLV